MHTNTSRYPSLRSRALSRRFKRRVPMAGRRAGQRGRLGLLDGPARRRSFFSRVDTQQVKTARLAHEISRAILAVGALAAWACVAFLIAA